MADDEIKCPSLPRKYITIVDLQKRWMEQQKKQQLETELNQNLSIKSDVSVSVRRNSNHQECNRSESTLNPNFKHRRPFYKKFKGKKQFQVINKQCEINDGIEDDQKVEYENRKVEEREEKQVKEEIVVDDQITEVKIGIEEKGDYQMAEKLDNQVKGDDQTAEIERKLKEVSLTTTKSKNEQSTAEMKRFGTVYRGHRSANHRGFGMSNRDRRENQGEGKEDCKSKAAIQGSRKVYGGYGRVENRGMRKNWEFKREKTGEIGNKDREKQAFVKRSRSMDAWQGQRRRNEDCRRLVWVKKSEIKENHNY